MSFPREEIPCGKCLVYCYQSQMREKVKKVMKYYGPRMLLHYPVLAMHHVVDGRKEPEKLTKKKIVFCCGVPYGICPTKRKN